MKGRAVMLNASRLTHRTYDDDDAVFFTNPVQSAVYCYYGAELLDLIPTEEGKFIYVFSKETHHIYRKYWFAFKERN